MKRKRIFFIAFILISALGCNPSEKIVREYYKNGMLQAELYYKHGKLNGPLRTWYENGQLHDSSYFVNDSIVGYSISYYKNGKKNLDNNYSKTHRLNGYSHFWYQDGTLGSIRFQIDDKIHGEYKSYFENGQLKWIEEYDHGIQNGRSIYFKQNGDTIKIETYSAGRLIDTKSY